jgi:hypothetical protein
MLSVSSVGNKIVEVTFTSLDRRASMVFPRDTREKLCT